MPIKVPEVVEDATFIHLKVAPRLAFSIEKEEELCLNDMSLFFSLYPKWHVTSFESLKISVLIRVSRIHSSPSSSNFGVCNSINPKILHFIKSNPWQHHLASSDLCAFYKFVLGFQIIQFGPQLTIKLLIYLNLTLDLVNLWP